MFVVYTTAVDGHLGTLVIGSHSDSVTLMVIDADVGCFVHFGDDFQNEDSELSKTNTIPVEVLCSLSSVILSDFGVILVPGFGCAVLTDFLIERL